MEVADGGVQAGGIGVAERERGAQVLERLGVGEQRAGLLGGSRVGLGCLRVAAGEPQVAGDRRSGAGQRVGRAAVEQAAACEARLLVDQSAQPLVAEVVVEAALADQPAADELLERADRLLLAAAAGGTRGPDVEGAPDHRRGREHLAGGLADGVQAGEQQLARTGGQRPRRVVAERVEVLDEQEREPLRLLVEAPRELRGGAGPGGGESSSPTSASLRRSSRRTMPLPPRSSSATTRRRPPGGLRQVRSTSSGRAARRRSP